MKIFGAFDKFFYWIGQNGLMNSDAEQQCQIRAPLDDTTFVTTADGLVSFIRLLGNRKIVGEAEFEEACDALTGKLKSYFKVGSGAQHMFGFGCLTDPDSAKQYTAALIQPLYATGRRYGIKSSALFQDIHNAVSALAIEDYAVMVVATHPDGLTGDERKRMTEWRTQTTRKHAKYGDFDEDLTQTPRINGPTLIPRHKQLVEVLKQDLENANGKIRILADVLHVDDAGRMLRSFLDRDPVPSPGWRLRYMGDTVPGTMPARRGDASHLMPVRIGRQLISSRVTEHFDDVECAKYGNWYYASVVMEMPPELQPVPTFAELDERIGRQLPWSVHFELLPNGLDFNVAEQMFSAVFGAFGENNKRIRLGFELLKEMQVRGEYVVALRAVFRTWARSKDKLFERLSFLRLAVQGWGSSVATNETGAPGLAYMSAAPGYAKRSVAPYMGAPLSQIIRMMPLTRSASVWKSGGTILRTQYGQPYPIMFGSTLQTYWGVVIFAPPGFGKSALLNCLNRGNVFAPGLESLPYITLVDVGMSGTGIINMLKAYLPPHLARQAVSIRVRNSTDYAVNPFDTQLGCSRPTENQRDFVVAVLATVCPNLGDDASRFLGLVVDETYRYHGPDSPGAIRFQRSFNDELNAAIDAIGFVPDQHTTVWEVVDALFKAGRVTEAWVAHRYAMPTLGKLIPIVGQPTITNLYGTAKTPTGELLIDVFKRNINTALSEFQMISTTTRYDIGDARIVVIDLEEIAGASKSEEGRRRTAVMYLFARQLGAGNYFLRWEEMKAVVPPLYSDYHERRVRQLWQQLKFLAYDEFHNASGIPSLLNLVEADLRQGRKYQVVAMLSSQYLKDFPQAVVEAANTYFILGTGSGTAIRQIQETFGLSQSEARVIETKLTGPDPVLGAPLFAYFKTNRGHLSQLLYNSMGPIELWCYTSSGADVTLRTRLADKLGMRNAVEFLASKFPKDGDARRYIEAEKLRMSGDTPDEERQLNDVIVERLLHEAVGKLGEIQLDEAVEA